MQEMLNN